MNARNLFAHWDVVRDDLLRGLQCFSEEDLDFRPAPVYERTVGDIALHIARSEDGWIQYVVRRQYDGWPAYDRDQYPTWQSIMGLLAEVHDRTLAWLETVDEAGLDDTVTTPRGEELTLRLIIWHVLEHEIHHRGELFLCLALLGREAPDI